MSPSRSLVVDREERRPHELVEGLAQARRLVLRRAVDVEPRPRREDGREERQALHVVPVEVGDERRARERLGSGRAVSPQKRRPVPRSSTIGVVARRLERDARRVAAVATVRVARARRRPPDAEEADVEQWFPPLPRWWRARYRLPRVGALV